MDLENITNPELEFPEALEMDDERVLSSGSFVTVSDDKMSALLNLASPTDGEPYSEGDIIKILRHNDIKQGIDKQKIKEILENCLYFQDIIVATGKKPVDGKDGFFTFHFRTEMPVLPKILEDGSVDYKNMDLFETVTNGQLLADYTNASPGEYGYTVYGELMKPRKGKELPALRGKGFVMSQDKKHYFSAMEGMIQYTENRLEITRMYTVEGDVDILVGNINFSGDVYVKGNVQSGFTIHSGGNVVVEGHVEAAEIYAEKSILLKEGMQGNSTGILHAVGTISGMFFESATLRAKQTINANYLLNCDTITDEKIVVAGRRGVIIGGRCKARLGISCYGLGNVAEINTKIEVGIDNTQMTLHQEIGKKLIKVESEIKLFEEGIHKVSMSKVQNDQTKSMYNKLMQALNIKNQEREKLLENRTDLMKTMSEANNARVIVKGIVNPGVRIIIDTSQYRVPYAVKDVVFVRSGNKVLALSE